MMFPEKKACGLRLCAEIQSEHALELVNGQPLARIERRLPVVSELRQPPSPFHQRVQPNAGTCLSRTGLPTPDQYERVGSSMVIINSSGKFRKLSIRTCRFHELTGAAL